MDHIEAQARYYRNLHLRDRSIVAVIHVEDKVDEIFWNNQLQNIHPGHYYFVSQSRSNSGVDSKGCEQCLKYIPYLNRDFFICIDSDLRLLRNEEDLTPENYIAQTYAYSWENHYCESKHLHHRYENAINSAEFDFISFLQEFSHIVYTPLLLLIHHKTPELNLMWNVSKFNACINLQPSRNDLANNGREYLKKTSKLFDETTKCLQIPEGYQIERLTPDNAYLHIQGHQLYKLILHIGTLLCRGKNVAFKSEILDTATQTSGYEEIDCVQSDLASILSI